jgi:hypothetical protein
MKEERGGSGKENKESGRESRVVLLTRIGQKAKRRR